MAEQSPTPAAAPAPIPAPTAAPAAAPSPTSARRSATPSAIPQKRPILDDEAHHPAVSSPLNPDFAAARARKPAPAREQREKKETLKKREAKGVESARSGTPDAQAAAQTRRAKKGPDHGAAGAAAAAAPAPVLINFPLPPPKATDFDPPRPPVLVPVLEKCGRRFYEATEHVYNRKGFRYTHCIADPAFVFSQYHRLSETEPFQTRFDYEDASSHILFDEPGRSVITEKGFRMAKANVAAREGRFYWECKILSGVKPAGPEAAAGDAGGHARIGFSRREAHLDTPVGFDAYSYGLRDVAGQKVHMSRPKNFMPAGEDFCEGDVIGLEINLPSLGLHRKVMDGTYNKAVDVSDEVEPQGAAASDIIRDRLPIRYKSHLYFEQCEYSSSKELEDLMNPSPVITTTLTTTTIAPNPNHPSAQLRTLPFSSIKVYKNGRYVGSPFTDLLAFLPPASKPVTQVGAREGLDDGTLGYYPSVSVFRGGAVEANFGPDFWFPPPELANSDDDVDMIGESEAPGATEATPAATLRRLRPFSERYNEQIAEDVVYDIIDEVDLWSLHGGKTDGKKGVHAAGAAGLDLGLGDSSAVGADAAAASAEVTIKTEQTDDIKEIVQEDE